MLCSLAPFQRPRPLNLTFFMFFLRYCYRFWTKQRKRKNDYVLLSFVNKTFLAPPPNKRCPQISAAPTSRKINKRRGVLSSKYGNCTKAASFCRYGSTLHFFCMCGIVFNFVLELHCFLCFVSFV